MSKTTLRESNAILISPREEDADDDQQTTKTTTTATLKMTTTNKVSTNTTTNTNTTTISAAEKVFTFDTFLDLFSPSPWFWNSEISTLQYAQKERKFG